MALAGRAAQQGSKTERAEETGFKNLGGFSSLQPNGSQSMMTRVNRLITVVILTVILTMPNGNP